MWVLCVPMLSHTLIMLSLFITEVRCAESAKIRGKYQDRIPVRRDMSRRVASCLSSLVKGKAQGVLNSC